MAENEFPIVKFFAQIANEPTVMTEILVSEAKLKNDIKRGIWSGVVIWKVGVAEPVQYHDGS